MISSPSTAASDSTLADSPSQPRSVGAITPRGFSLMLGERALFLSFAQFPWFQEFTLREQRLHGDPAEVVAHLCAEREAARLW